MADYIEREAFLTHEKAVYCKDCSHRKNSKGKMVYAIGDAPCRACGIMDVLDDLDAFPAADAIAELQQTVEHYKGCADDWYKEACEYKAMVPRWISVKERLPEHGTVVVAAGLRSATTGMFQGTGRNPWNWHWRNCTLKTVTHWMPLPSQPDENADGQAAL